MKTLSTRAKVLIGIFIWLGPALLLYAIVGSEGKNEEFKPQNEFKLEPWVDLKIGGIDLSINKAVLYLFLACALTTGVMIYIAKRMHAPPTASRR